LSLFACQKSNQKRQPERKQPLSGTAFQLSLWCCGEYLLFPGVVDWWADAFLVKDCFLTPFQGCEMRVIMFAGLHPALLDFTLSALTA
jgi:hypothetical protein